MLHIFWEFDVRAERIEEFVRLYAPEGAWAQLFQRDPAYCGTILLRSAEYPTRFLTVDCWMSETAYRAFRELHEADYAALDAACENLTLRETNRGAFHSIR